MWVTLQKKAAGERSRIRRRLLPNCYGLRQGGSLTSSAGNYSVWPDPGGIGAVGCGSHPFGMHGVLSTGTSTRLIGRNPAW
jgi:hypothetical protein